MEKPPNGRNRAEIGGGQFKGLIFDEYRERATPSNSISRYCHELRGNFSPVLVARPQIYSSAHRIWLRPLFSRLSTKTTAAGALTMGGNGINVGRCIGRGSMGYQVPNVIRFIRPAEYGEGIPTYIRAPGSWLKHVMRNSALGIGPRRGNRNAMEFVRITTRSALHVSTPGEDFNRDVIVPFLPRNLSRSSRRCGEDRAGN